MATTVWKGHLTFGLVSFPVKLFTAARSEGISFNQLHKSDNSRIKQVIYCQAEDKPIPRSEIVKGYEYEKDRYVVIEDEDIKKMAPSSAKVMEILEFVKTAEVDPIYFESSYYMAPDEAGQKALRAALRYAEAHRLRGRGEDRHAQSRAHRHLPARRSRPADAHHVLRQRSAAGGRISHGHRPGEGAGAEAGRDAGGVAGCAL
jgi:hypothetical protein